MAELTLRIGRSVKIYDYQYDIVLPLASSSDFKVGVKCIEDVPGGRVFELTVIYDKFDEVRLYTFLHIKGYVTYTTLEGQREFFLEVGKVVKVDKYYVSPWNSVDVYVSDVEFSHLTSSVNELTGIIRERYFNLRSGRGWLNYFKYHSIPDFIDRLRSIPLKFNVIIE